RARSVAVLVEGHRNGDLGALLRLGLGERERQVALRDADGQGVPAALVRERELPLGAELARNFLQPVRALDDERDRPEERLRVAALVRARRRPEAELQVEQLRPSIGDTGIERDVAAEGVG